MASSTDDPIVEVFVQEASELLGDYEATLLDLESSPDVEDALHRVFRTAHTLKGNASALGFDEVARFTHVLEDLLDLLRKGLRPVTPHAVDTLLAAGDVSRALLACVAEGREPGPEERESAARVRDRLEAIVAQPAADAIPVTPAAGGSGTLPANDPKPTSGRARDDQRRLVLEVRPPADALRGGVDPVLRISDLARRASRFEAIPDLSRLPALAALDPEDCHLGWRIDLDVADPLAAIETCLGVSVQAESLRVDENPSGLAPNAPPTPDALRTARKPVAAAEPELPSAPTASTIASSTASARAPGAGPVKPSKAAGPAVADAGSIRVPIAKVDRLINLVGELVITQAMVAEAIANFTPDKLSTLGEAVGQMDRHARELHEHMLAVRMLPIRNLFGRFPRMVRDLAASTGKQIALELAGEETELDKTVIEKIGDPLTHLVRNAIDHGLEPATERRAAGKPETGRLRMEAYHQGGSIYIEISDDGRGLNRERILAKALQNGLIAENAQLSEDEVNHLIFRPGFSTAEAVTELSGRGVGMDVVKRNVEELGGAIAISSVPGAGTRFRIKLPLTLAIMDGQTIQVADQVYVLPLIAIAETVRLGATSVQELPGGTEVVAIRNQTLPVVRLHDLFGLESRVTEAGGGLLVIAETDGGRVALLVDELLGQQQVVIKSLETNFGKVEGMSGATILGDGRVALILDVSGVVSLARSRERLAA